MIPKTSRRPPSDLPRQFHSNRLIVALATAIPTGLTNLRAMGAAMGVNPIFGLDRAWYAADRLRAAGALTHVGYGRWQITEKGRLAWALLAFQAERASRRSAARSA